MEFENTIGLETHVQLKTKMFCSCLLKTGCEPNTNVCPVCLGYPGALPVMNKEAVKLTVMSGMMLGCEINRHATFDRKNYFYPDMAKDYQISENGNPLCLGGGVEITRADGTRKFIRINHIHLEEGNMRSDVNISFRPKTSEGLPLKADGKVAAWRKLLPEKPEVRRVRMVEEYGIAEYDADVLSQHKANADFFESVCGALGSTRVGIRSISADTNDAKVDSSDAKVDSKDTKDAKVDAIDANFKKLAKQFCNLFMSDVMALMNASGKAIGECAMTPTALAALAAL